MKQSVTSDNIDRQNFISALLHHCQSPGMKQTLIQELSLFRSHQKKPI